MKWHEYADYIKRKLDSKGIKESDYKSDLRDLVSDLKNGKIKKSEVDKRVFGVKQIRENFKSYDLSDLKYYEEKK